MNTDEARAKRLAREAIERKSDKTQLVWERIAPVLRGLGMDNADVVVHLTAIAGAVLASSTQTLVKLGQLKPLSREQELEVTGQAIEVSRMDPHEVALFLGVLAAAVGNTIDDAQALVDLHLAATGGRK